MTSGKASRRQSKASETLKHVSYEPCTSIRHPPFSRTVEMPTVQNICAMLWMVRQAMSPHLKQQCLLRKLVLTLNEHRTLWAPTLGCLQAWHHHPGHQRRKGRFKKPSLKPRSQGRNRGEERGKLRCPPPINYLKNFLEP
jgi:hypothetical protein